MEKKILVTGANGQLGNELKLLFEDDAALFTDVEELDITNQVAVKSFFEANAISICINAAAFTAVDKAEEAKELATAINVQGPQNLAEACHAHGAMMIHVSTDFVFDGKSSVPYRETDPVAPLGAYGATKAEGELRVLTSNAKSIVLRTSWLYSTHGGNFMKTMVRLGGERDSLGVVDDQTGIPTWARDLAMAIGVMVNSYQKEDWKSEDFGIYHYSNSGQTTWCGFAQAIMKNADLACTVNPIGTEAYPTPAERPKWSVLDCSRIQERFSVPSPPWQDSLKACMEEYFRLA